MNTNAIRLLCAVAVPLLLSACGGLSSTALPNSAAHAPSGTAQQPGAATASTNRKVTASIFIPAKPTATKTSALSVAGKRTPDYVSSSTLGVAIVTRAAGSGTLLDSESFSTNSSDNAKCASGTSGTTCTFTVGAAAPSTSFAVTTYDAEPTTPTGGNATAFPSGAHELSTGSTTQNVVPGANPPVTLALGGIVNSIVLSPVLTNIPGRGESATSYTLSALDAAGQTIVAGANDPYATPITLALTEPASTSTLSVTDPGTQQTTTQPMQTITHSGETAEIDYGGTDPVPTTANYVVSLRASTTAFTDATSGTSYPAVSQTATLDPVTVAALSRLVGETFTGGSEYYLPDVELSGTVGGTATLAIGSAFGAPAVSLNPTETCGGGITASISQATVDGIQTLSLQIPANAGQHSCYLGLNKGPGVFEEIFIRTGS